MVFSLRLKKINGYNTNDGAANYNSCTPLIFECVVIGHPIPLVSIGKKAIMP
jgi:hypothetical protein